MSNKIDNNYTKDIQKSFNYIVMFNFPSDKTGKLDMSTYVKSVSIPNYEFKREIVNYGPFPKTFPVLASDGLELTIQFEEDEYGTVTKLIEYLQDDILSANGIYRNIKAHSHLIDVIILNDSGDEVIRYKFSGCYFLKASEVKYDYNTNDAIVYDITFGTDLKIIEY